MGVTENITIPENILTDPEIEALKEALRAVGKYLMRVFTRGHEPIYDAVLTISSIGVQVPLFFLTSFSDDYTTTILSHNKGHVNVKNHHYIDNQTIKIVSDITSNRMIATTETSDAPDTTTYSYQKNAKGEITSSYTVAPTVTPTETAIHTKTSEHEILRAVGVLATFLNLANNFDSLDGVLSSAPSVAIHRTNFENPFAYDPTNEVAIFRIFLDVIMQQGLLVDFEAPAKVYKNLMIEKMATAPKSGVIGVTQVTLTLKQVNIQDVDIIKKIQPELIKELSQ